MAEAIDAARAEVLLETYILEFTGSAIGVAEALERAAARGVAVRVVVDGVGTPDVPRRMAGALERRRRAVARLQPGARLAPRCCPSAGGACIASSAWSTAQVAFCGGINLIDDCYDPNYGTLDKPRFDFAVRVVGPLVADVHETMTRLWLRLEVAREAASTIWSAVRAAPVQARWHSRRPHAPAPTADDPRRKSPGRPAAAAGARRGPGVCRRWCCATTCAFAAASRRPTAWRSRRRSSEILIANAYFIPGVRLQRALLRAARRGVRITLLLQGRYEYFMQHHASRAVYGVCSTPASRSSNTSRASCTPRSAVMDGAGRRDRDRRFLEPRPAQPAAGARSQRVRPSTMRSPPSCAATCSTPIAHEGVRVESPSI